MKEQLTVNKMIMEAQNFCKNMSKLNHVSLIGVTDGKAVGTYIEHEFQQYLYERYEVEIGNSGKGLDFPSPNILTDIKVTSINKPQSSCPYRDAKQKIYGLGYNILVFVYQKIDTYDTCQLVFEYCTFITAKRTGDFITTKMLREIITTGGNEDDIIGFFYSINLPGDEITYHQLAKQVLCMPPKVGYLTISNALQWRLQYGRVIRLQNEVKGIVNFERNGLE